MRKLKCFLTVIVCVLLWNQNVFAADMGDSVVKYEKVYLNETCYLETVIIVSTNNARASGTKTGTKRVTYKADGNIMWYAEVTGVFEYDGTTSKCISASIDAESSNNTWKITSKSSSYTGNKAIGNVVAKQYYGIIAIDTINETIELTCGGDGTLS